MPLLNRVKILAPFWLVSLCYFTIPFIRDPIPPPAFFVNMDVDYSICLVDDNPLLPVLHFNYFTAFGDGCSSIKNFE